MNLHSFLTLLSFGANFCLAVFVLLRDPRAKQNRLYALFAFCVTYWAIVKFNVGFSQSAQEAALYYRLSGPGWCLLPVVYLHFVQVFTNRRFFGGLRVAFPMMYAAGAFFALCLWIDGLMLREMIPAQWGYTHVPGMLYKRGFSPFFMLTFLYGAYHLILFAIKARQREDRMKTLYLLLGIAFPLVGGATTNMILPSLGMHPPELALPLTTLNAVFIAIAVYKYRLLSITFEYAASTIIRTMPDALVVLDSERKVTLMNPATVKLLGYGANDIAGKHFNELLAEPIFDERLVEKMELEGVAILEADLLGSDRVRIPVRLSASPLKNEKGATVGFVGVGKDIRDLRELISKIERQKRELEEISITDSLTGVYNRRFLSLRLREEFLRAKRYEESFAVVIADLDRFKQINDTLGHSAGDGLLKEVAALFKASLRSTDVITRYGGDEFVILLPQSDRSNVAAVLGRIRAEMERRQFEAGRVTASFGVSIFNPARPVESEEVLLRQADAALYRAKTEGRDRICFAE